MRVLFSANIGLLPRWWDGTAHSSAHLEGGARAAQTRACLLPALKVAQGRPDSNASEVSVPCAPLARRAGDGGTVRSGDGAHRTMARTTLAVSSVACLTWSASRLWRHNAAGACQQPDRPGVVRQGRAGVSQAVRGLSFLTASAASSSSSPHHALVHWPRLPAPCTGIGNHISQAPRPLCSAAADPLSP